jgi:N-acetylmuramoyl-L-alanine amidase
MLIIPPATKKHNEFSEYRVVIDPGHGGIYKDPVEKYGDRYDTISRKYKDVFREGTVYRRIEEHVIMYQIGAKVHALLEKTESDAGFEEFAKILERYTSKQPARITIRSFLSRPETQKRDILAGKKDPNAGYRLFDYLDEKGKPEKGRISLINSIKPQLVVSLHCDQNPPNDHVGMYSIICPPYSFMEKGLEVLQKKRKDTSFFEKSPYSNWFEENSRRSLYKWFLNDCWIYFSGYPLISSGKSNTDRFKGYCRNMVQWIYSDNPGWEEEGKKHLNGTRYSATFEGFNPDGPYWERERSVYENYRRDGGLEGYGGDNFYSSMEILRYVLASIDKSGYKNSSLRIASPYVSTWLVPLYVNAISAYVELGYLKLPAYQHVLTKMQDSVAEGIAVGIYSLFAGIELNERVSRYTPRGKKIDLDKYMINSEDSYFEIVTK